MLKQDLSFFSNVHCDGEPIGSSSSAFPTMPGYGEHLDLIQTFGNPFLYYLSPSPLRRSQGPLAAQQP